MLSIKGFCTRRLQADNQPNRVATFGELSTYARTFSKDVGIYASTGVDAIEFNCFSNRLNGQANGILSTEFVDAIVNVTAWIYDKSTTVSQTVSKNDYLTELLNNFHGTIVNPNVGTIKFGEGRTMPEWVSFQLNVPEQNEVKFWLSSAAFERDYDDYEITVVSPLTQLDTLFRPVSEIRAALALVPLSVQLDKVQTVKNKAPESILKAESIQYINPNDPSITIDTTWYLLIYGPAGNNVEAIRDAIVAHILENSNEPESSWKSILPYLFKITRMYVLPRWDKMAIPNRQAYAGIYSPVSTIGESLTYAKTTLPQLANTFVDTHLQVTHHKYRAISLLCCGGEDNAQDLFKLTDFMPDYIAESATSQDFNRMSESTKQWTVMMEELLIMAEAGDNAVALPLNTRRLTVGTKKYIARRYGRAEYLVAIKETP